MFDSVIVPCPKCGKVHLFQSKSGDCLLRKYEPSHAPLDVLIDVNRHAPYDCECGIKLAVRVETNVSVVEVADEF